MRNLHKKHNDKKANILFKLILHNFFLVIKKQKLLFQDVFQTTCATLLSRKPFLLFDAPSTTLSLYIFCFPPEHVDVPSYLDSLDIADLLVKSFTLLFTDSYVFLETVNMGV